MATTDRAKAALVAIIRATVGNFLVGPRVDYLAMYPAKVVSQNGDGTLELQPDDSRLPGYSSVPIRYGIPGVTATVSGGARALLTWAGGDPQKPVVVGWEPGTILSLAVKAGTINLSNGSPDTVAVRFSDLKLILDAQTHVGNLGYPTGTPIVPLPSTVGSSVVNVK